MFHPPPDLFCLAHLAYSSARQSVHLKVVNFPVGFNSRPKAQFLLEPFIEEASDGEETVKLTTMLRHLLA